MKIKMKILLLIFTILFLSITSAQASQTPSIPSSINFSPYADLTLKNHRDLLSVSQKTGIKSYHLAFIADEGNCRPAWEGDARYLINKHKTWGSDLTDTLHAHGVTNIVSFVEPPRSNLSRHCSLNQLIAVYKLIITAYQSSGLDFDVESKAWNIDKVIQASKEILKTYPIKISFTLPVYPTGLNAQGKMIVEKAKKAGLIYTVNIMTLDFGLPQCVNHMDQCAIDSANAVQKYLKTLYPEKTDAELWQMIEITPMIGVNDVTREKFTLDNATTLRGFAEKNQIKSLNMWSIGRDNPCSDKKESEICSGANVQTKPFEFTERSLGSVN
jgi:chitinase